MKLTKTQRIIQEYVKNPFRDPSEIAEIVGGRYDMVHTVITAYKMEINLKLPLYVVKSLDLEYTYYLFTDTDEKMFMVIGNEIDDTSIFTEYELVFLMNEKGWV